jgi:hypothetical protein
LKFLSGHRVRNFKSAALGRVPPVQEMVSCP